MAMPDENRDNDPTNLDEVDAVANHPATDGAGGADEAGAAPDAQPDDSSRASGESEAAGQAQDEAEPGEAARDTTASPVASDQGESNVDLQGADAPGEDDVDAASADAGSDVPPSQPAGQPHEESSIDETDAPASLDEQDLVHQADARPLDMPDLESTQAAAEANAASIELLRDVELGVTIELGRCRMYVEDVLKLDQGAVVELDKLAGDPVDVYVNERLIARGEVLVLNDNFCVRINEIVAPVQEAKTA
jgi:flagellar motor switch protein FliN/FliY